MAWVSLDEYIINSLKANPLSTDAGGTGMNNMADAVVSQGTSGIWNYIKFANGIAICSGIYTTSITASTAWGSWYYSTIFQPSNFPFTFTGTPSISAFLTSTGIEGALLINGSTTASAPPAMYIVRPNSISSSSNISVGITAIGRWK